MELRTFIERAEKAAGSQKELGLIIGQSPSHIRSAKAGLQGLPTYACVMIADMIGEADISVIAASELTTEKKENRRRIWEKKLGGLAASLLLCSVTTVVTPKAAEASILHDFNDQTLYIMSNLRKLFKRVLAVFGVTANDSPTTAPRHVCCAG